MARGVRRLDGLMITVWGLLAASPQAVAETGKPIEAARADAGFVAGTTPDRRPEGAPRLTAFSRGEAWHASARTGISQPYPASLKFLDDQGAWFNPFLRPGMTGPYDIRGWHARSGQ